jgi:hypothetical protein
VATSFWPPVKCRVPRASRPRIGPGSFTRSQDPGISSHCVSWCEGTGARSLSVIPAVEVGFPSRLYCFWSDFVRCACVQCLSLTHARTPYVPNPATHSRPTAFFGPCHRRACLGSQTGVVLLARPCPRTRHTQPRSLALAIVVLVSGHKQASFFLPAHARDRKAEGGSSQGLSQGREESAPATTGPTQRTKRKRLVHRIAS